MFSEIVCEDKGDINHRPVLASLTLQASVKTTRIGGENRGLDGGKKIKKEHV